MSSLLSLIQKENDIKKIAPENYRWLAREIRARLIKTVSKTGGHLASNLGAVELTMALHLFLDFPEDQLVWDVGHQSYVHKILTGRNPEMPTIRQLGGISGFPKVEENPCDTFNTGHSSTSISVALGLAKARDLKGTHEKVVAVIGDGALTGGLALEALNNAEPLKSNMIIVLNDNHMSISKNVGGVPNALGRMRTNKKYNELKSGIEGALDKIPNVGVPMAEAIKNTKNSLKHLLVPGMFFEELGIIYIGPINGHDIRQVYEALEAASRIKNRPVLIHCLTKKGKGYPPAEENPSRFHGVAPFSIKTGEPYEKPARSYTKVFGEWLLNKGKTHTDLVSVCAAMPDGTGVRKFAEIYPERFFDVGIAEEHAVTFAAGLAKGGLKPVVSVYSTFLQRAYDEMIHDVCLNQLPVIFAVDHCGIVPGDGETHQGIFDLSYLTSMPNMEVLSPMNEEDLKMALDYAYEQQGPVAVRYPKDSVEEGVSYWKKDESLPDYLTSRTLCLKEGKGQDICIFAAGNMIRDVLEAAEIVEKEGLGVTVLDLRVVKPLDRKTIVEYARNHTMTVTVEDSLESGGLGIQIEGILQDAKVTNSSRLRISLGDQFIPHGDRKELKKYYGLDGEGMAKQILTAYE